MKFEQIDLTLLVNRAHVYIVRIYRITTLFKITGIRSNPVLSGHADTITIVTIWYV